MTATVGDADFERFWQAYPRSRRQAKKAALKAWNREKPDINAVLEALSWQTKSPDWIKDGGQYVPMASTYVNGRRWEDEKPGWAYREEPKKVHVHAYTKVLDSQITEKLGPADLKECSCGDRQWFAK